MHPAHPQGKLLFWFNQEERFELSQLASKASHPSSGFLNESIQFLFLHFTSNFHRIPLSELCSLSKKRPIPDLNRCLCRDRAISIPGWTNGPCLKCSKKSVQCWERASEVNLNTDFLTLFSFSKSALRESNSPLRIGSAAPKPISQEHSFSVVKSVQWESNPHFRHGKAVGYRYIMDAIFLVKLVPKLETVFCSQVCPQT